MVISLERVRRRPRPVLLVVHRRTFRLTRPRLAASLVHVARRVGRPPRLVRRGRMRCWLLPVPRWALGGLAGGAAALLGGLAALAVWAPAAFFVLVFGATLASTVWAVRAGPRLPVP